MELTKQDIIKWYHTSILPAGGTEELNKFMNDTAIQQTFLVECALGQSLIGRVDINDNGEAVSKHNVKFVDDIIANLKKNGYPDLEIIKMSNTVDDNGNLYAPGTVYKDLSRALKTYKKYNFNDADILKMHPSHVHIVENSITIKKLRKTEEIS